MLCTPKYTELHSYFLRDIEKLFDLVIRELLVDATSVHSLSSLQETSPRLGLRRGPRLMTIFGIINFFFLGL